MSQADVAGARPANSLVSLFFSFQGRINRARYWLGIVILIVVSLAIVMPIIVLAPDLAFVMIVIGLASLYVALALAVKRLHDRNKPGWWAILFVVAPSVLNRLTDQMPEDSAAWWILGLVVLVLGVWGLVELGFLKGNVGDNQYGPDPLAQRA